MSQPHKTERCPLCKQGKIVDQKGFPTPLWAERYGDHQLYRCTHCRVRFVAHDARLVSLRRCHHCTQWFIPTRAKQFCCGPICDIAHTEQLRQDRAEAIRQTLLERSQNGLQGEAPEEAGATSATSTPPT